MLSLPAALVAMAITGGAPGETVLLDFYADWCGPCRSMNPTVEQLAAKGYPVRRMNVDQYRDLAQRFRITSIPCFVMIVNGKEAGRVVGPTSIGRLEQLCSLGRAPAPNPNTMLAMPAPPRTAARFNPDGAPAERVAAAAPRAANVPVVPVAYTTPQQPPVSDAAMLAAAVRLRVEDPQGHSCGSGTIIDARAGGEALVLTCGHLFRDYQRLRQDRRRRFRLHARPSACRAGWSAYDLERDVGLVAFRPQGPVMVARVAPPGYTIRPGDAVTSVGCNNGDDPTVQHSRVNSLDRFLDAGEQHGGNAGRPHAPWNLQVAGQPVIGRSGGGLFSSDGMVIGVCNAAEPVDREGLFAALGSIYAALDQQGLASLYKQAVARPAMVPAGRSSVSGPPRRRSVVCRSHGRTAGASRRPGRASRTVSGLPRRNGRHGPPRIEQRSGRPGQRRTGDHGPDPPPRRRGFRGGLHHSRPQQPASQERSHHPRSRFAGLRQPAFQCRAAAKHSARDFHGSPQAADADPRMGHRDRLAAPAAVAVTRRVGQARGASAGPPLLLSFSITVGRHSPTRKRVPRSERRKL